MIVLAISLGIKATFWGFVSGSALLIGAAIGYLAKVQQKVIAFIMAFGSGVLISALAFDLMDDAFHRGGFGATAIGFISGAVVYTLFNLWLNQRGAKHRKRSGDQQASEGEQGGSGLAIAMGALLDGIPESIAIGVSMIEGGAVSIAAVVAIFLSNIPEGLSSTAGMKKSGRPAAYIFGVWGGIALISTVASYVGYAVFKNFSPQVISATVAVAAGAILSMLSDTMMPEAYEEGHGFIGVVTVLGFIAAFALTKLGGG